MTAERQIFRKHGESQRFQLVEEPAATFTDHQGEAETQHVFFFFLVPEAHWPPSLEFLLAAATLLLCGGLLLLPLESRGLCRSKEDSAMSAVNPKRANSRFKGLLCKMWPDS